MLSQRRRQRECPATIRMDVVLPHPGMLPSGSSIASPECSRCHIGLSIDYARVQLCRRRDRSRLSCSIGAPAFPSRPGTSEAMGRSERGREERSHPEPRTARFQREHGEDGEHRTFPEVSTAWHTPAGRGSGVSVSIAKRDVTKPVPHLLCQQRGAMPAPISLQRPRPQTPSYAPAHAATFSPGAVASGAARRGRGGVSSSIICDRLVPASGW